MSLLSVAASLAASLSACDRADSDLRAHVQAQLAVDEQTRHAELTVDADDGVVYLRGEVPSRETQRRAVEVTRAVAGVEEVADELRLSDQVVAEAVRKALAEDERIGSVPIVAGVREGVVRLESDHTGPDDRTRAIAVVSSVDGVIRVEDWMK